jgi:hypothetical protein
MTGSWIKIVPFIDRLLWEGVSSDLLLLRVQQRLGPAIGKTFRDELRLTTGFIFFALDLQRFEITSVILPSIMSLGLQCGTFLFLL